MTTWLKANWTTYGAIAKPSIPTALEGGASEASYQLLGDQYYNVPGCYTCHQGYNNADGVSIPRAAMSEDSFKDMGDAGNVIFPQVLRGNQ
jgi:photosynthetic reaction center cytochrome c subunit